MSDAYMTAVGLIGDRELTDEVMQDVLKNIGLLPMFKNADLELLKKQLESSIGISMSTGEGLTDGENLPWVDDIKASTKWNYWDSYVIQLKSDGFPRQVLRTLDEDTDNILTECGNPLQQAPFKIQGLVMGDVQSGKTASYCGLITKAADAGYKIIVLLTGMIEDLRAQSQERMDEGFVGRDSRKLIAGQGGHAKIGAGRFRLQVPNVLTSVDSDFSTANHAALRGIPLANIKEPVLLVMKKERFALNNLVTFLKQQMARGAQQLSLPLILIDDEADNASVNAKKDENPATINALIRELLGMFQYSSYVAYTATPFANVFINPDTTDLFPKNFVYCLNTPSNYIGVSSIFKEDGAHVAQIVDLEDASEIFPEKHTKHLAVDSLPKSMEQAIATFLLSCAIRDLRGESLKHRSMLINVSRFTDVQGRLAETLKAYLYGLVEEVKQYLADSELWFRHESLVQLKAQFDEQYSDSGVTWDQVRTKLYDSVASVKIVTINQKTEIAERLNYRAYKGTEKGRRAIVVGGLTLSRGLTLEGLCVSYFLRNSKAYDTLLQMGRWFGYRTGYEDLCRVWITPDAQEWFEHIADVVAELRADIRRMHYNRQPPEKFGMRVRSHPGALMVTAPTKMRNSTEVEIDLSFSNFATETAFLPKSKEANLRNVKTTGAFLSSLEGPEVEGTRLRWRDVPGARISTLLSQLDIAPMNNAFLGGERGHPLIKFIGENAIPDLQLWDISLPQGEGVGSLEFGLRRIDGSEIEIHPRKRQFEKPSTKSAGFLKLNRQRVGDVSDELVGMTPEERARAERAWYQDSKNVGKAVPGRAYRAERKRPLLTIHPIEPTNPKSWEGKGAKRIMDVATIEPRLLLALSISFPAFEETEETTVTYRLNKVEMAQLGFIEDEEDDED